MILLLKITVFEFNFEIGPSLMLVILKKWACRKWSRTAWSSARYILLILCKFFTVFVQKKNSSYLLLQYTSISL